MTSQQIVMFCCVLDLSPTVKQDDLDAHPENEVAVDDLLSSKQPSLKLTDTKVRSFLAE